METPPRAASRPPRRLNPGLVDVELAPYRIALHHCNSGAVTGRTSFEFSIGTKWLEALKQTAPHVTRVLLMFNPQSAPFADLFLGPVEAAAPHLSVAPIRAAVRDPADVDRMFDALTHEPNGGLVGVPDISMTNYSEGIGALGAPPRLPAAYP